MSTPDPHLKLYAELSEWWPLFSPPKEYVEEAADLLPSLRAAGSVPARTLLELGSGGGSLAYHLKRELQLTLTDVSEGMLAVSRRVNPECEHLQGDMRSLELGRTFDRVLIQDAIMYATEEQDVRAALATAYRHLRPGGGLLLLPDCVEETFAPETEEGGEDAPDGRGMRWLEWSFRPDPQAHWGTSAFAFLLRERDGTVHSESDIQRFGLFPLASWLRWLGEAGFDATYRVDAWGRHLFTATR